MEAAMIHDVDETLKALIRREVVNGSGVEVSFEAPTKEWAAKRTTPTVNCYLYDIREDVTRRDVVLEPVRDATGMVSEFRKPPRRFKLSYLLTAWTQRPEDEHRLLSALLGTFLKGDLLPPDLLSGTLADVGEPIIAAIALPPAEDRSISDVWTALGGELKPSLDLAIIAPYDVGVSFPAGPPVFEQPKIEVGRPDTDEVEDVGKGKGSRTKEGAKEARAGGARAVGGTGGRGAGGSGGAAGPGGQAARAPSAVEVELNDLGIPERDEEGKPLTLPKRLQLARAERERRRKEEAGALAAQDETMRSGAEDMPGRIIRIRAIPRED
jgi:hypothetical protein